MIYLDSDLHSEMTYRGRRIIIDGCHIDNDTIEIMVMDEENPEIEYECVRTTDTQEAWNIFQDFRNKYDCQKHQKLSGMYEKLREDLKKAVEIGKQHDFGEDGGPCNFDAPSIVGNGWLESMVKQAAKEAGTTASKFRIYRNTQWVIGVPTMGQANRRTRVAYAMLQALKEMGYETVGYSSLD